MNLAVEEELPLTTVSVLLGASNWSDSEAWVCPDDSYVVCQRLSEGHSPLRVSTEKSIVTEVYPQVRSLGFMPSACVVRMCSLELPFRTLNCFFDKTYFETTTEIDADGWYNRTGSFSMLTNSTIEGLMTRIHGELLNPGFGSDQMIEAATTMIAVEMARFGRQFHGEYPRTLAVGNQGLAPWQLGRIRERLAAVAELGYPSSEELSKICGISRGHLMRMFKASTGQPLYRFMTRERLNMARRMLEQGHLGIKEISASVGFRSAAHFSTAFRKLEGLTPSDFRRRTRSKMFASAGRGRERPTEQEAEGAH